MIGREAHGHTHKNLPLTTDRSSWRVPAGWYSRCVLGRIRSNCTVAMPTLHSLLAAARGLLPGRAPRLGVPEITIVALTIEECDRQVLSWLAAENRWTIHFAESGEEAWRKLIEQKAPIFLCARDVPGLDWRDAIQRAASAPHPAFTMLVSNVTDENLWNEVIRLGGHDVLATPFRKEQALRAIRLAWFRKLVPS